LRFDRLAQRDLGHRHESDQVLNQLIAAYGFGATAQIAEVYAYRGDQDHAVQWLERAYRKLAHEGTDDYALS
jgi:hypothetical protein